MKKSEIFGYSHFDIVYYLPFYLVDAIILLHLQSYISAKMKKGKSVNISINHFLSAASLSLFVLSTFLISASHIYGQLLIFSSLYLARYIFIFVLPYLVNIDTTKVKTNILQVILSSTVFQSLLVLYEQFKGGNLGTFIEMRLPGIESGTRASESMDIFRGDGTFNEPNIAAIYLFINLSIVLFSYFANYNAIKNKYFYIKPIFIGLILVAIVFTGSRSIIFLSAVLTLAFSLKYKKELQLLVTKMMSMTSLKIVVLIAIICVSPYIAKRLMTLKDSFTSTGSFSYRQDLNLHSLSLSNFSLLGIGIDMTPYFLARNFKSPGNNVGVFDPAPPHNIFIQIITEEGVVGFVLFILFLLFAFKNFIVRPSLINEYTIASFAFLIAAQFHPAFTTHPEILSFFFLYLGMSNLNYEKI